MTDADQIADLVRDFLAGHSPAMLGRDEFLRARFDAGLAWIDYPVGLGGLGLPAEWQGLVESLFSGAGAPDNRPYRNVIGLGMAAPTLLRWASPDQQASWLRPLWTGEEVWCQLFSEPNAGSDLAAVGASARREGDAWVVNGQKVWTSLAHFARWALLLVRTDPSAPKHRGLTFFVLDLQTPGVDVRPLRQMTGEAEFNEVFLVDVRVPDANRLGQVGEGWAVTQTTLMNERVAIGGGVGERGSGPVAGLLDAWKRGNGDADHASFDEVVQLWVQAEACRLASARLAQAQLSGTPGPEGSGLKLAFATLAQRSSSVALDLLGAQGALYDDWTARRPDFEAHPERVPSYWYLRNRANSIEGGTSEIMRNIIAERVLGLPAEPRPDKDVPWKDLRK